jgi:phosphatidate phosphatase PAH1
VWHLEVDAFEKKLVVVLFSASIFLVSNMTKLVVSDIDGTITRQAFS